MVRSPFAARGFRNSLFDDEDTAPMTFGRPEPSLLSADVGPGAVNRRADVDRVESLLTRTAMIAPKALAARGLYDAPVETGLRDFQAGRGLKVDGLLTPGGPTERTLRAQADQLAGQAPEPRRPGLKGLDGAAVAENARAVAHLAATRADGLYPDLLTETARGSRAGRSQVADFFAQLMRADHARAGQLRAKMTLAPDEDRRLFREIDQVLAADAFEDGRRRLAESVRPLGDADDNDDDGGIGTPPDEGGGGGGDEPPAYDPAHPQPGDPDDPDEPGEPDAPEKPKPDNKDRCAWLAAELASLSRNRDAAFQRMQEAEKLYRDALKTSEEKWQAADQKLKDMAFENLSIGVLKLVKGLKKLGKLLDLFDPSFNPDPELARLRTAAEEAQAVTETRLSELKMARQEVEDWEVQVEKVKEEMKEIGCQS